MVLSWLEDENRRRGLKYLGERFFGEDAAAEQRHLKELMKAETKAEAYKRFRAEGNSAADARLHSETGRIPGKTWATFTAEDIADYAAKDAHLTSRVYEFLLAHPEYAAIEPAVQRQHDVQAAAYRMTRRGIGIDKFRAVSLNLAALNQSAAIAAEFEREYGRDPGSDSEEGGSILRSPKQLGHVIYNVWGLPVSERTDSGKPSTAAAVLESMAGEHPGLDRILEYRRLVKAAQFYDGLLEHVDQDGRVHPGFNVVGTVTGRWTCSDPNLQQIPKASTNKDAKGLFVARPGYELVSFDLKSAELFVAASLAGDDEMMAALTEEGRSLPQGDGQWRLRQLRRAVLHAGEEPELRHPLRHRPEALRQLHRQGPQGEAEPGALPPGEGRHRRAPCQVAGPAPGDPQLHRVRRPDGAPAAGLARPVPPLPATR
jgi:hypothetical protein